MATYQVRIEGTAPLLMHRLDEQAWAEIEGRAAKRTKAARISSEKAAERAAYRMENGNLYLPAEALYQAMIGASVNVQVRGKGTKTYKSLTKGCVNVLPEYIDLGVAEYAIDSRRVRIQRSGAAIRHRPRLEDWSADFEIEILDDGMMPKEIVLEILQIAGQQIGVLDYRPRFGRFMVARFE